MIIKGVEVLLTKEEIESPEPISIVIDITDGDDVITYTIDYPKEEK